MKKIICDICGKEIKDNENWIVVLNRNENNSINNPDFKAEDICKKCAKNIYNCLRMMTECSWKPDFHEATESGDFLNDEQCLIDSAKMNVETTKARLNAFVEVKIGVEKYMKKLRYEGQ